VINSCSILKTAVIFAFAKQYYGSKAQLIKHTCPGIDKFVVRLNPGNDR